jgi:hypothetical protein
VIKEAKPNRACGLHQLGGRSTVRLAGRRVSARVIVSNREGLAIVAEHRVEDLSDGDERSIDRPFCHDDGATKPVGAVAHEDDNPFATASQQLNSRGVDDVAW